MKHEVCFVWFVLAVQEALDLYFWVCYQLVKEPSVPTWKVSPWMTNCVRRHDEIAGKEHPAHSARPEASLMLSLQNAPPASMRALFPLLLPAVLLLKLCNDAASGRSDHQIFRLYSSWELCHPVGICWGTAWNQTHSIHVHTEKHLKEKDVHWGFLSWWCV